MQGVIILFFALLVWGSSLSWGACSVTSNRYPSSCDNPNYDIERGCGELSNDCVNHPERFCSYSCGVPAWGASGDNIWHCQVITCSNACEADSLGCVTSGKYWLYTGAATCGGMSCSETNCDTTMQCIEYPFNHCEEVPSSGQVYCDANGCTGLPYTKFWSEYRKECSNQCGQHDTQSFTGDTLISFDSDCSDSVQCSNDYKCVDFPNTRTYLLYSTCVVGNGQVGNNIQNRSYVTITGGGNGNCASAGYKSSTFPNSGEGAGNGGNGPMFPNTNNNSSVSDNCLIYGVDCPPDFVDSTNYNNGENRTPEKCICEPLDGMKTISSIICPDGSRSTFFGSCDDWNTPRSSSSSNPPESSSSGSENPPASSGGGTSDGISGEYPEWPEIRKNTKTMNDLLGSVTQSLKSLPSNIVDGIKSYLNGFVYSDGDGSVNIDRVDSMMVLDTILDTAGLLHAVFGRIDSNNTILDTLSHSSFVGCPCITFFQGNNQHSIKNGHLVFKEMTISFANIKGFNLCRIISAIVVALASVVSFFIGFSIFKNISQ